MVVLSPNAVSVKVWSFFTAPAGYPGYLAIVLLPAGTSFPSLPAVTVFQLVNLDSAPEVLDGYQTSSAWGINWRL